MSNLQKKQVKPTLSASSASESTQPTETAQEVLLRLEKASNAKQQTVEELKEKLYVAQEERHRAFLELATAKEQYLISAVNNLQTKLAEFNKAAAPRTDNLASESTADE